MAERDCTTVRAETRPTLVGQWREMALGEVIELKRGYDLPKRKRIPGSVPLVSSSGISDCHIEAKVQGPGVVTGRYGTLGEVYFVPGDFWPLNTTLYVRDFKGNAPRFIAYLLKSFDFSAYSDKAAVPGVNRNHLHQAPVRVPALPKQRAIAHILGTLDDKIELNRRMNQTLEEVARAIFKDWFIDFGPTRAKMEGREPYLPVEVWDLFPDSLVDSELGEIPEGWEVKVLGDCFNLTMGQSPPGRTYNESGEGLPFFQGRTDFGFRYPEKRRFCTEPKRIAESDDTLVSVRAPVGDINMAWEKCCIGRGVAALRHKSGASSYTYHCLWSIKQEIQQYEHTGTVFGAINKRQFETLMVIEPPTTAVDSFETHSRAWNNQIRSKTSEFHTLATQRDVLLPWLVSGKVRAGESDAPPMTLSR